MMPRGAASTRGTLICRIWPNSCRRRVASPGMIRLVVWVMEHMGETESFSVRTENWEQKKISGWAGCTERPRCLPGYVVKNQLVESGSASGCPQLEQSSSGPEQTEQFAQVEAFPAIYLWHGKYQETAACQPLGQLRRTTRVKLSMANIRLPWRENKNLRCGKPAWCSNELFPAWPQRKKHGLIILVTVALISSCLSPWSISHREWTYWCSLTIVLHLCQSQAWVRSQAPAPWALRWWSPGNFQPPKIQQAYVRGWSVAIGSHWKFVRKIVHFESFKGTILLLHFELA